MEEEIKDVEQVEPSPTDEVVKEISETATVSQEEVTEDVPSTQEVKPEVHDRPVENVAWEVKRKLDETIPTLQNEIRELKTFIEQGRQPATPQYTKAQLQAYAGDPTTTTEQSLWAYTEVDKIERDDRKKEYETLVSSTRQKTEAETRIAQSAQWVSTTFPETVIKDGFGNVSWNNQSQLLNKANEYMNRSKSLRDDPEGFAAAVKMAAFDMGVSMNLQNKVKSTVGQLRKEQKKQLASTGGTRVAESSENASKTRLAKLQAEYNKTGSREIFAEIIKAKGINPYAK